MQHCRYCGVGEFKISAAIPERSIIEKILNHPRLDPQSSSNGRARESVEHLV
jgi:hypothetical protein